MKKSQFAIVLLLSGIGCGEKSDPADVARKKPVAKAVVSQDADARPVENSPSTPLETGKAPETAMLPSKPESPPAGPVKKSLPVPYKPCPGAGKNCRILPLGDSITAGSGSTDQSGYRVPLLRTIKAKKRLATYVGPILLGPESLDGQPFPRNHAGYSGALIDPNATRRGISENAVELLIEHKPHIVTLMIGTNDLNTDNALAEAPARLGKLLDRMIEASPEALIVLAKVVPSRSDTLNAKIKAFNAKLDELVSARTSKGKHLILIDMYTPFAKVPSFKTALFKDDLHPKDEGYLVMAGVWYTALESYLDF